MREEWKGFKEGAWTKEINVSDFIKNLVHIKILIGKIKYPD